MTCWHVILLSHSICSSGQRATHSPDGEVVLEDQHLPTEKITIILEDVHRILWVPVKWYPILFEEEMIDEHCKSSMKWLTSL